MSAQPRTLLALLALALVPAPPALATAPPRPHTDALGDPLPAGAIARLGTTRLRHGTLVPSVAWSPDGKLVAAAGGGDKLVHVWDPDTGRERARLAGHVSNVSGVAFSPDGKLLASCGQGGKVFIWEVAALGRGAVEARQVAQSQGSPVSALAFLDAQTLVTASGEGGLRVWDLRAGREVRNFGAEMGGVRRFALSFDRKRLAAIHTRGASNSSRVWLWDVTRGEKLGAIGPEQKEIYSVAFSPDGQTLATGSSLPELWEVASGSRLVRLGATNGLGYTPSVAFSPDGRTLLAGGASFLREWRVATGRPARSFAVGEIYTYAMAFSPGGKTLATGCTSGVGLWDYASGTPRHPFPGHQGEVSALAFFAGGRELLTGGYGRALYRWDLATGKPVRQFEGPISWHHTLTPSPDGKTLVMQGRDLALLVVDADTLKERVRFTNHLPPRSSASTPQFVAFAPDGKTVVSATMGVDYHVRVWEADTAKEVRQIATGKHSTSGLALSPDGKTVYTGSLTGPVRVWDLATGKLLRSVGPPGYGTQGLTLSADGRRLAACLGGVIVVWDSASGKELRQIPRPRGYGPRFAFTPDGRTVVVLGEEEPVRFWEVASGQARLELRGHSGVVKTITFARNGRTFATGSSDTTALVWDLAALLGAERSPAELTAREREALWADLAGEAPPAYRAVARLAHFPTQVVALLGPHFNPPDRLRLDRLIAQLDDDDFDKREAATKELAALGRAAEAAIKRGLAGTPSLEVRRRLRELQARLNAGAGEGVARLRGLRALEVLETAGTPQARKVLETVARGDPDAEATVEAKAALARLARRAGP